MADLRRVATRIQVEAKIRAPSSHFLKCDIDVALSQSRFANNVVINTRNISVLSLEDVGGMKEVKRKLLEVLIWPFKYSEVFQTYGLCQGRGVLLHGPSGCGKTLLAKAAAAHSKYNSIFVKGPELLSKYIGSSEENVRNVFERARASAPCIIIFDELDSLAPQRGSDSTGVADRVVNQMLTEMDGVEVIQGVFVIGCSSRIDLIDSALLRPGRFDHILECRAPNEQDRSEILEIVLRSVNHYPSISTADWAKRTDGWTGADLKALITNAQFDAERNFSKNYAYDEGVITITNENIEAVFEDSRPRRSIDMRRKFRVGEKVTLA
ncbi:ATPase, AAA family [Dictyocaulus viviparus]|uniref:ATPase, AAA family n=1 Tax=Dictyocaulus viviparus TaxID=29172 RepID=A0A0D8XP60_DICVI|nr:ATPase, AAA family [Dictyocaulus viviparus]